MDPVSDITTPSLSSSPSLRPLPPAASHTSAPEQTRSYASHQHDDQDDHDARVDQYSASKQYARQDDVPKRIHIMGMGSVGKLVAHSLRGLPSPPPLTLILHRKALLDAWKEGKQEIVLETDGYHVPRTGFDVELQVPQRREHGVEIQDGLPSVHDQPDLPPHEAARLIKEEQDAVSFKPFQLPAKDEPTEPIHNLIVTVKATMTVSAIDSVKHRLLPSSTICFLQNGLGVIDEINTALFPDPEARPNYVQGIITHGVNVPRGSNPFFAIHAGHGTIALGILPRASSSTSGTAPPDLQASVPFSPTSRYLIRTLTRTPVLAAIGLPPLELLQQQLEKLAVNCVLNPLTVMLDARNGSILYNFALTRTMRLLLGEISLVLRSLPELRGLPNVAPRFSPERLETLVVGVSNRTRDNISSMLADVRNGKPTEVAYLNGYIVKRGEELGLQCVCNYMLMQLVLGKYNMVARERLDTVPISKEDLTGET